MDGRARAGGQTEEGRRIDGSRLMKTEKGKRGKSRSGKSENGVIPVARSLTPSPATSLSGRKGKGPLSLQGDGWRGALSATPESDLALMRLNYAVPLLTLTPRFGLRASGGMSANHLDVKIAPPFSPGPG